jgi:F-type H+-transporting ATPase subunit b
MRMRTLMLPALLLVATAAPAWAAEEGGRGLMDISTAELVAALITFFVLVILLGKLAWKPILSGLQEREATIKKALDDAQKANEDALALLEQYGRKMDEARTDAQAIADGARKEADAARQRIETDARERAEETLERSLREIQQAKETALDDILKEVGDIAAETASRIVRRELAPADNARIVDDVVKDFARSREGQGA